MFDIGEKIVSLRKKNKINQDELADALDISKQSILNYETGKRQIPIDTLSKIADYFNIPIESFFSDQYENFKTIKPNKDTVKLPVFSSASAGLGNFADDEIVDWIEISKSLARTADFVTFADGDSMEPRIPDWSLLLVQNTSILDSGEIGVFVVDESVYCKRFQYNQFTKEITLKSLNLDYQPKKISQDDDFRIIGRVVGVIDYTI